MWVYGKNIVTGKMEKFDGQSLFIIKVGPMGWTRRKFEHLSMETVDNNAEKYAREVLDKMVRYIVAEVAETKEELETKLSSGRPKVDKRLSLTEVAVNLSAFKLVEETIASTPIVKKKLKKIAGKEEEGPVKKKKKHNSGSDKKDDFQLKLKESEKTTNASSSGSENVNEKLKYITSTNGDNDSTTNRGNKEIPGGREEEDESSMAFQDLTKELEVSKMEVVRLTAENKMLREQNKILANVSKEIKNLPGKLGSPISSSALHGVKSLKVETEFEGTEWDEKTQMYVGCGRVINRDVLESIDDDFTSFNARGVKVMNYILDEDIAHYSKSGDGKDHKWKPIPEKHISAFRKIMKAMSWGSAEDFSDKKIQTFLNKQPNEERRKLERAAAAGNLGKKTKPKEKKKKDMESSDTEDDDSNNSEDK